MEPAEVRALWFQKEGGAGPGSRRRALNPVLSLCRELGAGLPVLCGTDE